MTSNYNLVPKTNGKHNIYIEHIENDTIVNVFEFGIAYRMQSWFHAPSTVIASLSFTKEPLYRMTWHGKISKSSFQSKINEDLNPDAINLIMINHE